VHPFNAGGHEPTAPDFIRRRDAAVARIEGVLFQPETRGDYMT
jgi:hypothetical protein